MRLKFGFDPNASDYDGRTTLHNLLHRGVSRVWVDCLLAHGARVDIPDRWNVTAGDLMMSWEASYPSSPVSHALSMPETPSFAGSPSIAGRPIRPRQPSPTFGGRPISPALAGKLPPSSPKGRGGSTPRLGTPPEKLKADGRFATQSQIVHPPGSPQFRAMPGSPHFKALGALKGSLNRSRSWNGAAFEEIEAENRGAVIEEEDVMVFMEERL